MTSRAASLSTLLAFGLLVAAVAAVGGLVTAPAVIAWYPTLTKPSFNPPNAVFGPVWSVLYAMMAVAAWRVWRADGWRGAALPLSVWAVQLALNLAWSLIFFGWRQPGLALAEIGMFWLAVAATMVLFWRRDRPAGLLFVPYLAWVSFASLLNFAIWRLNG